MIGKITGIIDYISTDHILVDVSGVGYLIYITNATINKLPGSGQEVSLFTELVVKEELLQLIGFSTPIERDWYKLLTSVQGVGSKAALALLGHIPIRTLSRAILLEDSDTIKEAQGIGPKIAKRLVLELKGKVPDMLTLAGNSTKVLENIRPTAQVGKEKKSNLAGDGFDGMEMDNISNAELDAISALVNLGYSQIDSSRAVALVVDQGDRIFEVEDLIKRALQVLVKKE